MPTGDKKPKYVVNGNEVTQVDELPPTQAGDTVFKYHGRVGDLSDLESLWDATSRPLFLVTETVTHHDGSQTVTTYIEINDPEMWNQLVANCDTTPEWTPQ